VKFRGKTTESGKSAASIQDVADAAGVSIATVSRVLNNPGVVSAATAEKVRSVIEKLGYVPNPFAQGLITRESRVLCFALPDMHGEFYSELIRGADAEAHTRGYHLLVSSEARGKPATHREHRNGLGLGLADGLAVMVTEPAALEWATTGDHSIPVVLIDIEVSEPGVDCVVVDNAAGTREAVEHLLHSLAPHQLYFVGGPEDNFDSRARADAFVATLAQHNHNICSGQISFGTYGTQWGSDWFDLHGSAIRESTSGGPIGVLAGNDEIALGVLQAAEDAGLNVPRDLKLVGFDDSRLASLLRPKLSSVRVPTNQVGGAAISLLAQRLEDPSRAPTTMRLATKLIVRESSQ
jgi:LacI family transcriptional regulator